MKFTLRELFYAGTVTGVIIAQAVLARSFNAVQQSFEDVDIRMRIQETKWAIAERDVFENNCAVQGLSNMEASNRARIDMLEQRK